MLTYKEFVEEYGRQYITGTTSFEIWRSECDSRDMFRDYIDHNFIPSEYYDEDDNVDYEIVWNDNKDAFTESLRDLYDRYCDWYNDR